MARKSSRTRAGVSPAPFEPNHGAGQGLGTSSKKKRASAGRSKANIAGPTPPKRPRMVNTQTTAKTSMRNSCGDPPRRQVMRSGGEDQISDEEDTQLDEGFNEAAHDEILNEPLDIKVIFSKGFNVQLSRPAQVVFAVADDFGDGDSDPLLLSDPYDLLRDTIQETFWKIPANSKDKISDLALVHWNEKKKQV